MSAQPADTEIREGWRTNPATTTTTTLQIPSPVPPGGPGGGSDRST